MTKHRATEKKSPPAEGDREPDAGRMIVPVAHNAGDYWPKRGWRKKPGTVKFVIGPPIDPTGKEPRQINLEVQDWIEQKVAELRKADS